ncbi:MAG: polymerase sigma-70 factor, family [Pseudonocardiales bacterium]|nr:polymerase sigma-70 factor, family [Pseudonocardiales bacterium]
MRSCTTLRRTGRQRARAKLDDLAPNAELLSEPDSPESRSILDRFMSAFERADIAALAELLRRDATLEVRTYSTIANIIAITTFIGRP